VEDKGPDRRQDKELAEVVRRMQRANAVPMGAQEMTSIPEKKALNSPVRVTAKVEEWAGAPAAVWEWAAGSVVAWGEDGGEHTKMVKAHSTGKSLRRTKIRRVTR
jgi:phage gp16-like protein